MFKKLLVAAALITCLVPAQTAQSADTIASQLGPTKLGFGNEYSQKITIKMPVSLTLNFRTAGERPAFMRWTVANRQDAAPIADKTVAVNGNPGNFTINFGDLVPAVMGPTNVYFVVAQPLNAERQPVALPSNPCKVSILYEHD